MKHSVKPRGVCSRGIEFEINDGLLTGLAFEGGCPGNLAGLARLAQGRPAREVAGLLAGVRCGDKKTSCPDQLARAIKKALKAGQTKGVKVKP